MRLAMIAFVTVFVMVTAGDTAGQRQRDDQVGTRQLTISVPGIPGPYCMYGIEKRLSDVPEIGRIDLRWDAEEIRINVKPGASVTRRQLEDAVERSEYPYTYSIAP